MTTNREKQFFGAFVGFSLTNFPPIHRLVVSEEELRLLRPLREPVVLATRTGGEVLRYGRWAFPPRYFFLVTPPESVPPERAFVPWSGRRLLSALRRYARRVVESRAAVRLWSAAYS